MGLFRRQISKADLSAVDAQSRPASRLVSGDYAASQYPPSRNGSMASRNPQSQKAQNMAPPKVIVPMAPSPDIDPLGYLRSLNAIRERSRAVYDKGRNRQLNHFDLDMGKMKDVTNFVVSIIKRDHGPNYSKIQPYSCWQHFEVGGRKRIDELVKTFADVDQLEHARRVIDLLFICVMLDVGPGMIWGYKASNGKTYRRSEGVALAVLDMYQAGIFSSNPMVKCQVDGAALSQIPLETLAKSFQLTATNVMIGFDGRAAMVARLGHVLLSNHTFFGSNGRPGNMVDHLLHHPSAVVSGGHTIIPITALWTLLSEGLAPIWPQDRSTLNSVGLGDAWPAQVLPSAPPHAPFVPFHKLTQWLAYSIMTPLTRFANMEFAGTELLTGLPEHRNGGLFMDTGLLVLKSKSMARGVLAFKENAIQRSVEVAPVFQAEDDVVVEWRALTIALLDTVRDEVNKSLNLRGSEALTMGQLLGAGTWQAGRELAERPNTRGPPIAVINDGTIF